MRMELRSFLGEAVARGICSAKVIPWRSLGSGTSRITAIVDLFGSANTGSCFARAIATTKGSLVTRWL
jgi:hypothetical protein